MFRSKKKKIIAHKGTARHSSEPSSQQVVPNDSPSGPGHNPNCSPDSGTKIFFRLLTNFTLLIISNALLSSHGTISMYCLVVSAVHSHNFLQGLGHGLQKNRYSTTEACIIRHRLSLRHNRNISNPEHALQQLLHFFLQPKFLVLLFRNKPIMHLLL